MTENDWKLSVMIAHGSVKLAVDLWKACEDAGLYIVGAADSQNLMREIYVSLAACALNTSHAKIMTYATNPVTRHPTVTAGAFVALDELAPGRMMMGIATGDSAMWSMGRKPAKLQALRDYMIAVKALCLPCQVRGCLVSGRMACRNSSNGTVSRCGCGLPSTTGCPPYHPPSHPTLARRWATG